MRIPLVASVYEGGRLGATPSRNIEPASSTGWMHAMTPSRDSSSIARHRKSSTVGSGPPATIVLMASSAGSPRPLAGVMDDRRFSRNRPEPPKIDDWPSLMRRAPPSLAAEWRAIRLSGHHGTNGQRQFIRRRLFDHERRCPGAECRFRELPVAVGGHENHPHARRLLLEGAAGVKAAHVRQRNIDDHNVGMERAGTAKHRAAIAGFADHRSEEHTS